MQKLPMQRFLSADFAATCKRAVERTLLLRLDKRRLLDLRAEDDVPELAGDTEAVLVVQEVVFQVVLLELLVPQRQILMVQEVVCHVVACVAENAATVDCRRDVPIPKEDGMGEGPEGSGKHCEKRRRHDETVLVHGQVVVDTVQGKMKGDADAVVRKVAASLKSVCAVQQVSMWRGYVLVKVEQEAVEQVLEQGPEANANKQVQKLGEQVVKTLGSRINTVGDDWPPQSRHNPPRCLAQRLEEVSEEWRRLSAPVMSWTVDLVEIKLLAEASKPDLREEWFVEVQKLVLLEIFTGVRLPIQVLRTGHACPWMNPLAVGVAVGSTIGMGIAIAIRMRITIDSICVSVRVSICMSISVRLSIRSFLGNHKTNERFLEDFVGSLGVSVGNFVLQNGCNVFASVFEDQFGAARVTVEKIGNIVDIVANSDKAVAGRSVQRDVVARKGRENSRRHLDYRDLKKDRMKQGNSTSEDSVEPGSSGSSGVEMKGGRRIEIGHANRVSRSRRFVGNFR